MEGVASWAAAAAMQGALPSRRQPAKAGQGSRRAGFPLSRPGVAAVPQCLIKMVLTLWRVACRGSGRAAGPIHSTPG